MLAQVTSDTIMKNSFVEILEGMGAEKTYSKPRFCNGYTEFSPRVETPGSVIHIVIDIKIWENHGVKNMQREEYLYFLKPGQSAHTHLSQSNIATIVFVNGNITYICQEQCINTNNCTQCVILSQEADAK